MNHRKTAEGDYEDILASQDQKKSYYDYSSSDPDDADDADEANEEDNSGDEINSSSPINNVCDRDDWKQSTITQQFGRKRDEMQVMMGVRQHYYLLFSCCLMFVTYDLTLFLVHVKGRQRSNY